MLDHVHRIGEVVVVNLYRCHACFSVASPEFPRTRHAAANQIVNQLYIGVCAIHQLGPDSPIQNAVDVAKIVVDDAIAD
jgi:hypothetical protein